MPSKRYPDSNPVYANSVRNNTPGFRRGLKPAGHIGLFEGYKRPPAAKVFTDTNSAIEFFEKKGYV